MEDKAIKQNNIVSRGNVIPQDKVRLWSKILSRDKVQPWSKILLQSKLLSLCLLCLLLLNLLLPTQLPAASVVFSSSFSSNLGSWSNTIVGSTDSPPPVQLPAEGVVFSDNLANLNNWVKTGVTTGWYISNGTAKSNFPNAPAYLTLKDPLQLSGVVKLKFDYRNYYLDPDGFFGAEVYDGNDWVRIFTLTTRDLNWRTEEIDISAYGNDQLKIRFVAQKATTYLDNVVITQTMPEIELPGSFILIEPSDGLTEATSPITLSWEASEAAENYDLYFGESIPASPLANISGTSYELTLPKDYNATYQWQVVAKNAAGQTEAANGPFEIQTTKRPDLLITDIRFEPINPTVGDLVRFSAAVKNAGLLASPAGAIHRVNFSVDGGSVISQDNSYRFAIAPGETVTIGGTTNATWTALAGTHTITATIDEQNLILESDETNNSYSENISVGELPDLIIENISWYPMTPITGEEITFSATIKNIGNGASPAGRTHRVAFGFNGGSTIIWSDEYTWPIEPGESALVSATWGTNGPTWLAQEGEHTIRATVDDIKIINESDETNNTSSQKINIFDTRIFAPEEDYDGDGLTNAQELLYGTDMTNPDTDGDLISDYDEIFGTLGSITDPLNPDTDGDGIFDGTEIKLGSDPLTANANIPTSREKETPDGLIKVTVYGDQNLRAAPFRVEESDNILLKSLDGIIGKAVDITIGGYPLDSASIVFKYSAAEVSEAEEDNLTIFWVDRDNKRLVPLAPDKVTVDKANKTVTGAVNHFSTYLLGHRDMQVDLAKVDIVFTIDQSGSMSSSDPQYYRLVAAKRFVQGMDQLQNRAGIVEFTSSAAIKQTLTGDKDTLHNVLDKMRYNGGGTNMGAGLLKSREVFGSDNINTKVIILLSDGQNGYGTTEQLIALAREYNSNDKIVTNTVALGRSADVNLLQSVAGAGSGGFFYINNASGLTQEQVNAQIELLYVKLVKQISLQKDVGFEFTPQQKTAITFAAKYYGLDYEKALQMYTWANVHLLTGNFLEQVEDLSLAGAGPELSLVRTYNSAAGSERTILGNGWRLSYDSSLRLAGNSGQVTASLLNVRSTPGVKAGNIITTVAFGTELNYLQKDYLPGWHEVLLPDKTTRGYVSSTYLTDLAANQVVEVTYGSGSKISFAKDSAGNFKSPYGVFDKLAQINGAYELTRQDQSKYTYNSSGQLTSIEDKYGNNLALTYTPGGELSKITDPAGRSLTFAYYPDQIEIMGTDSPGTNSSSAHSRIIVLDSSGRHVEYNLDAAGNLVSVRDPSGEKTTYNYYPETNWLKQIVNAAGKQVILNDYDPFGRVVRQYDANNCITYQIYQDVFKDELGGTNQNQNQNQQLVRHYINKNGYQSEMRFNLMEQRPISEKDSEGKITTHRYYLDYEGNGAYTDVTNIDENSPGYALYSAAVQAGNSPVKEIYTDRNGNTTQYFQDPVGNVTGIINPDGSSREFTYNGRNSLLATTDEVGNSKEYLYAADLVTLLRENARINPAETAVTQYTYYSQADGVNIKGLIKTVTDPRGHRLDFTYNAYGQVRETIAHDNIIPAPITTTYNYNNRGWKTEHISPEGYRTTFAYDTNGRLEKTVQNAGESTRILYDNLGRKVQEIAPNQYDSSLDDLTAHTYSGQHGYRYEYYDDGNLKAITDPEDNSTEFAYDPVGNLLSETKANGAVYLYQYDSLNRITELSFRESASVGAVLLCQYSYHILAGGKTQITKTEYTNSNESITTTYTYDYAGRQIEQLNPDNTATGMTYNANGTLKTITDAKGNTASYSYDGLNRLTEERIPFAAVGNTLYYTVKQQSYDHNGNIISEKISAERPGQPEKYRETNYNYNSRNQLTTVTSFDNQMPQNYVQYCYDAEGNKVRMYTGLSSPLQISGLDQVEPCGDSEYSVTKYNYNHLGKATAVTDPLNNTESYAYDQNGNLISFTDRNQNHHTMTYDHLNRLLTESVSCSDSTKNTTVAYTYDEMGNRQSMTNGAASANYVYDKRGRLIRESNLTGIVKIYNYDLLGNRTSFVLQQNYTDKINTGYTYDSMRRLHQVYEGQNLVATYDYDENGNRTSLKYPNGNTTTYSFNPGNMLETLTNMKGSTVLSRYTYTYGRDGNQLSKTDHTGKTTEYGYDGLGRLTAENETISGSLFSQTEYTYDDNSNRKTMTAMATDGTGTNSTGITVYEYDLNSRLLSETKTANGSSETTAYTYDNNGNQIGRGSDVYTYNGFNQLSGITADGTTVAYIYNGDGLRISKTINGASMTHIWDGSDIVMELDGSEAIVSKYTRGINLIAVQDGTGANRAYYLFNGHGDIVQLTQTAGDILTTYDYDAFGNEKNPSAGDANPFRYCGEYLDLETNTYYLRARNYDPTIGRFLTEDTHWNTSNMIYGDNPVRNNERIDPLELNIYTYAPDINAIRQSANLYAYCGSNPVIYVDQDGEIFMLVTGAAGAVVGGVAGGIHSYAKYGEVRWQNVVGGAVMGGAIGLTGGAATAYISAGSVTASTGVVLTEAGVVGAGSGTVVIGESMNRVVQYANKIDAKTYSGLANYNQLANKFGAQIANFLGKVDNAKWLLKEMVNNTKIVDIGIDVDRASRSSSYLMEKIITFFYNNKEIVNKLVK